jgi:hypothetical protein
MSGEAMDDGGATTTSKTDEDLETFRKKPENEKVQCQLEIKNINIKLMKKRQGSVIVEFGIKDWDLKSEKRFTTEAIPLCPANGMVAQLPKKSIKDEQLKTEDNTSRTIEITENPRGFFSRLGSPKKAKEKAPINIHAYSAEIRFDVYCLNRPFSKVHLGAAKMSLANVPHDAETRTEQLDIHGIVGDVLAHQEEDKKGTMDIKYRLHYAENIEYHMWEEFDRRRDKNQQKLLRPVKTVQEENGMHTLTGRLKPNTLRITESAMAIIKESEPLIDLCIYIGCLVEWRLSDAESCVLLAGYFFLTRHISYWPVLIPLMLFFYNKWYWTIHGSNGSKHARNWKDKIKDPETLAMTGFLGSTAEQLHEIARTVSRFHIFVCDGDKYYIWLGLVVGVVCLIKYELADDLFSLGGSFFILSHQRHARTAYELFKEWIVRQMKQPWHGRMGQYAKNTLLALGGLLLAYVYLIYVGLPTFSFPAIHAELKLPTFSFAAIQAEGMRWKETYMQPMCSPTRAAVLTRRETTPDSKYYT